MEFLGASSITGSSTSKAVYADSFRASCRQHRTSASGQGPRTSPPVALAHFDLGRALCNKLHCKMPAVMWASKEPEARAGEPEPDSNFLGFRVSKSSLTALMPKLELKAKVLGQHRFSGDKARRERLPRWAPTRPRLLRCATGQGFLRPLLFSSAVLGALVKVRGFRLPAALGDLQLHLFATLAFAVYHARCVEFVTEALRGLCMNTRVGVDPAAPARGRLSGYGGDRRKLRPKQAEGAREGGGLGADAVVRARDARKSPCPGMQILSRLPANSAAPRWHQAEDHEEHRMHRSRTPWIRGLGLHGSMVFFFFWGGGGFMEPLHEHVAPSPGPSKPPRSGKGL